jgi:hypothetical protein
LIAVELLLPADIPEITRFFPTGTFSPLVGEVIFTLCALGCFVRERVEMVLLLLMGAEAWLFGNICANAELVKSVEPRRKMVSTPTIEGSGNRADNLILHLTNSMIVGPPIADNFLHSYH